MNKNTWQRVRLGEVAYFQRGYDLPKTQMRRGIYPVAGSNGIIGYHDTATTKAPCITIGRSGNIGKPKFYNKDFWAHNTTLFVKDFFGNNEKFVFYMLQTMDLSNLNSGSAVPTLNRNYIHSLEILLPPLETQHKIAEILSSFDDKIDLLTAQNKTLESLALTLFRHYFINNPKNPNAPCNSEDTLASLKTDNANEKWEIGKLGDYVKIVYGKNLPTKNLLKQGYAVFGGNGKIGYFNKYLYEEPQVLISCRGEASGKVNISESKSFITNNSLVLERVKDQYITFEYLKYWCLSNNFSTYVSGSAQPQITIEGLYDADFLKPNLNIIREFSKIVLGFENKISHNMKEILNLESMRDIMLSKLLSGEVEV